MTDARYRPIVAIEVTGLLAMALPPGLVTNFTTTSGADITFRSESFPTRFVVEPRWDAAGQFTEKWAFLGRGVKWVGELLAAGTDVVWASRYQEFANVYFSSPLGLPDLPVATLDDGRRHATEAGWKASQLGRELYNGRPLLWVNDELTAAGRFLLERWRRRADHAISYSKYIPDSASEGDVESMNEWLELARSSSGQRELQDARARYARLRRRGDFSSERLHREWALVRSRIAAVVDFRSGLAAPLAAYAVDRSGELDIRVIEQIRAEWGLPSDPPALDLLPLLEP